MGCELKKSCLMIIFLSYYLLLFSLIKPIKASIPKQQELDRIKSVPGQPPVTFAQFSGYITVNEQQGRALFYWFIEAQTAPQNKPLVLWITGGPGCSTVSYGATGKIGPFKINKNGSSLYLNKYSWTKDANIIFLDSPAGAGFSYTNTTSNLKDSGDRRTAEDSLIFVIRWMSRFPQYKYREFYIIGESYAGHYVPQLAKKIHDYNKAYQQPAINLTGFMVGNAVMDHYYDSMGTVTYWWTHAMISDKTYKWILKSCNFSVQDPSKECNDATNYAMSHEFGNIDQYNIYAPICLASQNSSKNSTRDDKMMRMGNSLLRRKEAGYDPCMDNYAVTYYNRPDVQKAMHANLTRIPYKWSPCSEVLYPNWKDSDMSILPIYKELIAAGLRIWLFSGDTDSIVPVTATRFSLNHLNLSITTQWYPWYSGKQVGGWTEVYNGLTFATVRGAGHQAPLFQPRRSYIIFRSFLAGKELPKSLVPKSEMI